MRVLKEDANIYLVDKRQQSLSSQFKERQLLDQKMIGLILDYSIYLEGNKTKLDELVEQYRKSILFTEMQNVLNELIYIICTALLQMKNSHYRKEIIEIMNYIDAHIGEKITLSSIASQINMNESYISRLFKSETGMNIIHYINVSKMEKAKELLKEKNMIVKNIQI